LSSDERVVRDTQLNDQCLKGSGFQKSGLKSEIRSLSNSKGIYKTKIVCLSTYWRTISSVSSLLFHGDTPEPIDDGRNDDSSDVEMPLATDRINNL